MLLAKFLLVLSQFHKLLDVSLKIWHTKFVGPGADRRVKSGMIAASSLTIFAPRQRCITSGRHTSQQRTFSTERHCSASLPRGGRPLMDRRNVRSLAFATMQRSWKGSLLRFDDSSTNKGLGTLGIQSLYRSWGTYCRHLSAEPSF
jgi:hypothetical protein